MAMTFYSRAGYNPVHGRDPGPLPPRTQHPVHDGMNSGIPSQPYYPGVYYNPPMGYCFVGTMPPHSSSFTQHYPQPTQQINTQHGSAMIQASNPRLPQPRPAIDQDTPSINIINSTGGVGCEPGYNYLFPREHTKIVVLRCNPTPPWQLGPNATVQISGYHVPAKTTIAELMDAFGADNPDKRLNTVTEVAQGGNGKWIKGLQFSGADKKDLKLTIGEVGWDKTRTGRAGEKPVVYLYITKE